MLINILKKDLKRKKTMNIILLLFIILATMFVASSINNIITVMNGTDYYLDKANLGDYVILTMGEDVVGRLDNILEDEVAITSYRKEEVIYASEDSFTKEGKHLDFQNLLLIQNLSESKLNFFDEKNNIVDKVEPGKIYLTSNSMKVNNIEVGDKIRIKHGSVDMTLEVAGRLKDALLGSTLMGNTRVLVSDTDYKELKNDVELCKYYSGEICYVDTDDTDAISQALSDISGIAFNKPRSVIKMCYVMDMIVAGIILILSVCLILVAFIVLKFTINFTLEEEFREIGVMKAIGIRDANIRNIYIIKYLAIAILGAVIGLFLSIPFSNILLKSVSENMFLGNDMGVLINIVSAVVVVIIIIGYAYFCTRKLNKFSPLDAIRNGQIGERFSKKSVYRLASSHLKTTTYMAINDVMSSLKRYVTIILAFSICSLLVFMVENTANTMESDKLVTSFGKGCDAYYTSVKRDMECMTGKGDVAINKALREMEKQLLDEGIEAKAVSEVQFSYKAQFDGKTYKLTCQKGIGAKISEYEYLEGSAPQNKNEIAITKMISEETGAKIGDTMSITVGDSTDDYLVTAYFQSMNQMGELVRIHEDVPTDMKDSTSLMFFGFDFAGDLSQAQIDENIEKMKDIFESDSVYNAAKFSADCIHVVDTMKAVKYLLLVITLIVVILVTVLMERSFISDEKSEIAILKAIGFKDNAIVEWHMKRFVIVDIISVVVAILISVPATNLCVTPIFKMMGMEQVEYKIAILENAFINPAIILLVTIIAAGLTALYTRKITSSDTASIE